jgi:hypothetical protein
MLTELPPIVQRLVDAYLKAIEAALPGFMQAFYLHGSIALGDFQPRFSDIDFICVIARRSTAQDIARLQQVHRDLKRQYPHLELSGSYLQAQDLGRFEDAIDPYPYYQDGVLYAAGHHDVNAVTWWVLKNHGLALAGPDPQDIDFTMDWQAFIAATQENLNSYWAQFTRPSKRMTWLLSDFGIQWAVLGVLRQFYTFRERDITSKAAAGEYALVHLPERWQRIIQEALNIRRQTHRSLYRLRTMRAVEAVRFLTWVIRHCNSHLDPSSRSWHGEST